MAKNSSLNAAKDAKNDEFYTQYEDIQAELNHYEKHFKEKTVMCNCDDPFESNFCKFFLKNFNYLGLKRLICTSYATSPIIGREMPLFDYCNEPVGRGNGYVMDISKVPMANGRGISDDDIEKMLKSKKNGVKKLKQDGDFRSKECVDLLKQADIVVTNPPFSMFREYILLLNEFHKNYILIGNMNALHYKEIFPLIKENKIWVGYGFNLSMVFKTPYSNILEANRKYVKSNGYNPDEGYVKTPAIAWFTNLDIQKRHESLVMYRRYSADDYVKYINYDAIDVGKVADIPMDYYGAMGVPDSFLERYNPEQFEIIGYGRGDFIEEIGFVPQSFHDDYHAIGGKGHITKGMKSLCFYDENRIPRFPYSRIIIRRRRKNNED